MIKVCIILLAVGLLLTLTALVLGYVYFKKKIDELEKANDDQNLLNSHFRNRENIVDSVLEKQASINQNFIDKIKELVKSDKDNVKRDIKCLDLLGRLTDKVIDHYNELNKKFNQHDDEIHNVNIKLKKLCEKTEEKGDDKQ